MLLRLRDEPRYVCRFILFAVLRRASLPGGFSWLGKYNLEPNGITLMVPLDTSLYSQDLKILMTIQRRI